MTIASPAASQKTVTGDSPSLARGNRAKQGRGRQVTDACRRRRAGARLVLLAGSCATLSHMEIGVRDLRNRTGQVIDAVQAGERVTLTVHGEPIADIVPHGRRARWLSGEYLREQLRERAADPELEGELDELAGQTLDEL
jgi:prevent-host-death family protein